MIVDYLQNICLIIIGLAGGIVVSGGVFAFITILGIVPRIAARTGSAAMIYHYETCIILGGTFGNVLSIFRFHLPVGQIGMGIFGIFAGIFVGCLSMALAETLKVIPVFVQRTKIINGMPVIILFMALGKGIGSFLQLYMHL